MAQAVYVQKGEILDFTNTTEAEIGYNEIIPLGGRIGVSKEAIPVGAVGSVAVTGVYEVPADTVAAFVAGETLYWDAEAGKAVKTAGDIVAGWAFADKAAAGSAALVKIG